MSRIGTPHFTCLQCIVIVIVVIVAVIVIVVVVIVTVIVIVSVIIVDNSRCEHVVQDTCEREQNRRRQRRE